MAETLGRRALSDIKFHLGNCVLALTAVIRCGVVCNQKQAILTLIGFHNLSLKNVKDIRGKHRYILDYLYKKLFLNFPDFSNQLICKLEAIPTQGW